MFWQHHNNAPQHTRLPRLLRRALPTVCGLALVLFTFYFLLLTSPASAQVNTGINQFGEATVLSGDDIRVVVARIIRTFLGVLGVIGVGIVLYGGFLWMTAKGEPDKMETAKKLLANGAIGLAIVLSSFGIAQFVLNKLVEATGSGGGQTETCTNPAGCPPRIPPGLPGGCADPGGTDPYICSVVGQDTEAHPKPNGPVGSYVTLYGGRFGTFLNGTSVVKIGDTAAAVVACGGLPNWRDDLAVVEVPELDPAAYPVSLTNKDGKSTIFSSGGLASGFTVTTAPLGPQIACIDPDFGPAETTNVRIEGKRFGDPAASPTGPTIASVTPTQVRQLQYVTISGSGFGTTSGTVRVTASGFSQTISPVSQLCGAGGWKDDEVVIMVPSYPINAYDLTVIASGGATSNTVRGFSIAPPPPGTSMPPRVCRSDVSGTTVTVDGLFSAGHRGVRVNGTPLTTLSSTNRIITADASALGSLRRSDVLEVVSIVNAAEVSNPVRIGGSAPLPLPCQPDGTNCGTVQFTGGPEGMTSATTTAWADTEIRASVPKGATTGDVNVVVDAIASNGYRFRVTCAANNQCSLTNCCIAEACFEAAACLGRSCTTDADCATGQWCNAGRCEERRSCTSDADCPTGQMCDETSQSCRTPQVGDACDADARDAACTVDATKCGASLVCSATTCQCEAPPTGLGGPVILDVSPAHRTKADGSLERCALATDTNCVPNGAPGNLLTIRGSNFGADVGSVTIAGITAAAPAECSATDTWTDTAIVVAVPSDIIASGPIIVTVGGKSDATNDANGSRIADFQSNSIVRPGLCSATNAVPGGTTTAAGIQFGDTAGSAFVGTTPIAGAGVQNWTATSTNVIVPLSVAAQQTTLAIASASGEQSNAVPLTIGSVSAPPTISSMDPLTGGLGSYVTIAGEHFGHGIGKVRFHNALAPPVYWLNPTLPAQCAAADWWTDEQITLRIPEDVSKWVPSSETTQRMTAASDLFGAWGVEVCTSAGVCSSVFIHQFTVTDAAPLPGICAVEPVQGPLGTEVKLHGERFGSTTGRVKFGTVFASVRSGGDMQEWRSTIVRVMVPLTTLIGAQDVRLWQDGDDPDAVEDTNTPARENRGSNPVRFTVADCRTEAAVCTTALPLCCPANGQCVLNAAACPVDINTGAYQWTFTTGETPKVPRVVESCSAPSPAPWNGHGDAKSRPACINAKVRVEFSTGMAFSDASATMSGIKMYTCAGSTSCSSSPLTAVMLGTDTGVVTVGTTRTDLQKNVITIAPPTASGTVRWEPNTRYQVVVHGTSGGGATALTSAVSSGGEAYALDGDGDGVPGGNYRFEFVTGAEVCAPDTVTVAPPAAVLSQPWRSGDAIGGHAGLAHLAAEASSSQHTCQTLDERSVDSWGWTSNQNRVAVAASGNRWCTTKSDCGDLSCTNDADCPSGVSCTDGKCNFCDASSQCIGFPWTTTAAASGDETPVASNPATVEATAITNDQQAKNDSQISVRFAHPTVGTTYPARSCRIACMNTLIAALITPESVPLDPDTVSFLADLNAPSGTVGLFACGDETCRRSVLTPVDTVHEYSENPTVEFCAQGKNSAGTTCANGVGRQQQIVIDSPTLQPNTSYRVVIDGKVENDPYGVELGGLNFDRIGDGTNDSFSWTFRTGTGPCAITRLTITPEEVEFSTINERRALAATPWSAPDACTPEGQPVDPGDGVDFKWEVAAGGTSLANFVSIDYSAANTSDNKPFTDPSLGLLLKTTVVPGPSCSTQCLLPGSRRANGICGNGILEAPAEECESQRSCVGGARPGAVCTTDADCPKSDGLSVSRSAGTCTGGTFPSWCDRTRCLLQGTTAPTCGNGTIDDGEECDKRDADGVQIVTFPPWCDPATCLNKGSSLTCKNGTLEPGEDCDSDAGCSTQCLAEGTPAIPARCGDGIVGIGEECDPGSALSADAWKAIACDYNRCLTTGTYAKPGPSFWYTDATTKNPTPSVCGDGYIGAGEACDIGSSSGYADPVQILQSVGSTPSETTVRVEYSGATSATARVSMRGVGGDACGYDSDAAWAAAQQCTAPFTGSCDTYDMDNDDSISDDYGINTQGCGAVRPRIIVQQPGPNATNVCPNALVTVRFDTRMDPSTFVPTIVNGVKEYPAALVECLAGNGCTLQEDFTNTTRFRFLDIVPQFVEVDGDVRGNATTVHEVRFPLTEQLKANTKYFVYIAGAASGLTPVQSADGVAFYGDNGYAYWAFTTDTPLCDLDVVQVAPPSALLQRREEGMMLQATGYSRQDDTTLVPITALENVYAWQYTWTSSAADIATVTRDGGTTGESCGTPERCASGTCVAGQCVGADQNAIATPTAQASGKATATATARIIGGATDGASVSGSAVLTVMYCEHPWPDPSGMTWSPYVIDTEDIAISYCRDAGTEKVCRSSAATAATQDPDGAKVCTSDVDCAAEGTNTRCLPRLNDDLPVPEDQNTGNATYDPLVTKTYTPPLSTTPITTATPGARELRKEFFLLPRNATSTTPASYCSGSGERCDDLPTGFCPPGEFCKPADDAIGIRLYENEEHVAAAQWYDDAFDDAASPVTVDGYRGVQAGRSTYINYANTGSLFTNLAVLSYNDDATAETRTIFQRLLDGIALTQDVDGLNTRMCSGDATVSCTSNLDCAAQTPPAGTCAAPADKLRRDVQRVEDLALLQRAITNVTEGRRRCSVTERSCDPAAVAGTSGACPSGEACVALPPALASGTFLSGMTTSKWPSWQQELGRELGIALPSDPLNAFGGQCVSTKRCGGVGISCTSDANCATQPAGQQSCDVDARYEQTTCWNATDAQYTCPAGSHVYQYERKGDYVELGVEFEYRSPASPAPGNQSPLTLLSPPLPSMGLVRVKENICGVGTYDTSAAMCGDGLVKVAEEDCEPGITPPQSKACTRGDGKVGLVTRHCTSACAWSVVDATWNVPEPLTGFTDEQCAVKCGNGVVDDASEQCDVGRTGGRVPTRGGVVPGVTPNTAYECTAQCQWKTETTTGLVRCGDTVVQSGYGERCDGSAGIANNGTGSTQEQRTASSEFKQYSCDVQCRPARGYCGDFIVQDGSDKNSDSRPDTLDMDEECDDDKTVPCVSTAATFNRSNATQIDIYSLQNSTNSATVRFQNRITSVSPPPPYHPKNIASSSDAVGYITGESAWFIPMEMDGSGDVLVTLVTSNSNDSVQNLSGSAMQSYVKSSTEVDAITDFNPDGVRGTGVYHRIHLGTWNGTTLSPLVTRMVRAASLTNPQTTEVLLSNVSDSTTDLILIWDNDYSSGSTDSNLAVHSVAIASTRTHRCGDSGAANACVWESGVAEYTACTAIPTCGNGKVDTDKGEVCDDSRADGAFAGRCSNDPKKQCYRKPDGSPEGCADGGTCEPNADACTTQCRANVCGDSYQLVAQSCIAGPNIGKTCRTNAECGVGGVCAQEACDQGVAGNFTPTQLSAETCTYGRNCNYCTTQCTIATKQGGFCGDGIVNGSEVCDDGSGTSCNVTCTGP